MLAEKADITKQLPYGQWLVRQTYLYLECQDAAVAMNWNQLLEYVYMHTHVV